MSRGTRSLLTVVLLLAATTAAAQEVQTPERATQGASDADFDLYFQKWNGFWWATVARSESATSEEQIAYSGTPGYYRWVVSSYSGSGAYSFWLQRP